MPYVSARSFSLSRAHLPSDECAKKKKEVIKSLRRRHLIPFKADKGNQTVVCTAKQYADKIDEVLNSGDQFNLVHGDIDWNDRKGQNKVSGILKDIIAASELPPDVIDLVPFGAIIPRLYGLPKIHKPGCPFRPILSMVGSNYHAIARFLDEEILKPIYRSSLHIQRKIILTLLTEFQN